MNDTIAAIATSIGIGSISIIRVSGKDSIAIVNKIFKGKDLEKVPTHTISYGHIMDSDSIVDEVLVSVMKSPKSFTTEDVVEINCHGGIIATKKVLESVLLKGARLANPGEFTERAFLNGRIDLLEAEGIMDIIEAKTEKMQKLAINQLGGKISKMIHNLREKISKIITNIEVNIDYPEYDDIKVLTNEDILPNLTNIKEEMVTILKDSENINEIKKGIKIAIIGKPNVGKSSLLNSLIEEEKAIVTDIPGTTRDIVEGSIAIDGIPFQIIDTAGIRNTEDKVENIGVKKSLEYIEKADFILFVLNNNEKITKEELELFEKIQKKNYLILINKMDLEKKIEEKHFSKDHIIEMSLKENKGIEELKNKIKEIYHLEQIEVENPSYLTSARSIALLKEALEEINSAIYQINEGMEIDMVEIDIRNAWNTLGLIIGETYEEELLDQLFSQFCLGK